MVKSLSLFIFLFFSFPLIAQQDTVSVLDGVEKSSRLTYSANYNSHLNFEGRNVFVPQNAFTNTIMFSSKQGYHVSFTADYWDKFSPRGIAQNTVGVGYEFAATKWLTGSFDYEHWFINYPNDTIRTALTNYISTEWQADFDFFGVHTSGAYMFGTESAYNIELGVKGIIEFDDVFGNNQKNKIAIMPDITLMSGTDVQFATINSVVKAKKKTTTTSKTTTNEVYGLLNTELTLPVTYSQPRWNVTAAYHYAIPHALGVTDIVSPAFGYFVVGFNWHIFVAK